MSALNEQLTVRIELCLAPRTQSLQSSRSDITTTNNNNNIIQPNRDASSSLTTTETSINSLIQTPSQHAFFQKNKDDLNVKRSEALLKESHEFMKYLQKKYNLSTTQPADILGRQISRMKKCEDNAKKSSSS
uniref:Uncharacterized protein n=1 Tax=Panagrolaimus sp. ES5 TaxID=591445 RepID=A0AC34F588_9BILA